MHNWQRYWQFIVLHWTLQTSAWLTACCVLTFVHLAKFLEEWLCGFWDCLLSADLENGGDDKEQGIAFWALVVHQVLFLSTALWSCLKIPDIQVWEGGGGAFSDFSWHRHEPGRKTAFGAKQSMALRTYQTLKKKALMVIACLECLLFLFTY